MLSPSSAIVGSGLGTKVALITDGRFSGATHGKYPSPSLLQYTFHSTRCNGGTCQP